MRELESRLLCLCQGSNPYSEESEMIRWMAAGTAALFRPVASSSEYIYARFDIAAQRDLGSA